MSATHASDKRQMAIDAMKCAAMYSLFLDPTAEPVTVKALDDRGYRFSYVTCKYGAGSVSLHYMDYTGSVWVTLLGGLSRESPPRSTRFCITKWESMLDILKQIKEFVGVESMKPDICTEDLSVDFFKMGEVILSSLGVHGHVDHARASAALNGPHEDQELKMMSFLTERDDSSNAHKLLSLYSRSSGSGEVTCSVWKGGRLAFFESHLVRNDIEDREQCCSFLCMLHDSIEAVIRSA